MKRIANATQTTRPLATPLRGRVLAPSPTPDLGLSRGLLYGLLFGLVCGTLGCAVATPVGPGSAHSAEPVPFAEEVPAADPLAAGIPTTAPAPTATTPTATTPTATTPAATTPRAATPAPGVRTASNPLAPPAAAKQHSPTRSWSALVKAGRSALRVGDTGEAENRFAEAYTLTRNFRPGDPRTTTSVNNLQRVANAYLREQRMGSFERVMDLLAQVSGDVPQSRTPQLAHLFKTLAGTFAAQDRQAEARVALERALAIQGERNRESDPALVAMHAQLGITYLELGDESLGRYHIQLALGIAESAEDGDGPLYAQALVGKAMLESRVGQPEQAEADLQAALDINTRYFGAGSHEAAAIARELATLFAEAGRNDEAREQYERIILIFDGMPREPFSQALARNDLAWFLIETGEPGAAESHGRDALELLEAHAIEGQPLASVADTLATALRDQQKYDEAETLYQRAIAEGERGSALPGWTTADISRHYAGLLDALGRTDEAKAVRRNADRAAELR